MGMLADHFDTCLFLVIFFQLLNGFPLPEKRGKTYEMNVRAVHLKGGFRFSATFVEKC